MKNDCDLEDDPCERKICSPLNLPSSQPAQQQMALPSSNPNYNPEMELSTTDTDDSLSDGTPTVDHGIESSTIIKLNYYQFEN